MQMSAPTDRPAASRIHRVAPARTSEPTIAGRWHDGAIVVLIVAVVVMAVLPDLVQYLNVKHVPATGNLNLRIPLARDASLTASIALFLVCAVIVLGRGYADRNVFGAIVLLLGLIVPYAINPTLPSTADVVKAALAAAVILAVWNIGAPVDRLKWVAVTASMVGAYTVIAALIIPEHMNFNSNSTKGLIANWELAGPFGHSNSLGAYCVLGVALVPLIAGVRWRILNGLILCTAIVASASRTALIAAGVLALWWIICRFRSVTFVRLAGTALIGICAAAVLALPLLSSSASTFTGRGYAWAVSLSAWQESPLVGLGLTWFTTTRGSPTNSISWAFPTGHNLVVDTLVRSGLVGMAILVLVLLAATRSIRSFDVSSHQIAFFGYLIAFLVISTTEAIWVLLPSVALFPVVGLVFAVLITTRHDAQKTATEQPMVT